MSTEPYINTGNLSEDELVAWLSRLAAGRGHIDFSWAYKLEQKMLPAIGHAQEALAMIETKLFALQSGEFHQSETLTNDIQKDIDVLASLAPTLSAFVLSLSQQIDQVQRLSRQRSREIHIGQSDHERE